MSIEKLALVAHELSSSRAQPDEVLTTIVVVDLALEKSSFDQAIEQLTGCCLLATLDSAGSRSALDAGADAGRYFRIAE